jgi:hypothetical protein
MPNQPYAENQFSPIYWTIHPRDRTMCLIIYVNTVVLVPVEVDELDLGVAMCNRNTIHTFQ